MASHEEVDTDAVLLQDLLSWASSVVSPTPACPALTSLSSLLHPRTLLLLFASVLPCTHMDPLLRRLLSRLHRAALDGCSSEEENRLGMLLQLFYALCRRAGLYPPPTHTSSSTSILALLALLRPLAAPRCASSSLSDVHPRTCLSYLEHMALYSGTLHPLICPRGRARLFAHLLTLQVDAVTTAREATRTLRACHRRWTASWRGYAAAAGTPSLDDLILHAHVAASASVAWTRHRLLRDLNRAGIPPQVRGRVWADYTARHEPAAAAARALPQLESDSRGRARVVLPVATSTPLQAAVDALNYYEALVMANSVNLHPSHAPVGGATLQALLVDAWGATPRGDASVEHVPALWHGGSSRWCVAASGATVRQIDVDVKRTMSHVAPIEAARLCPAVAGGVHFMWATQEPTLSAGMRRCDCGEGLEPWERALWGAGRGAATVSQGQFAVDDGTGVVTVSEAALRRTLLAFASHATTRAGASFDYVQGLNFLAAHALRWHGEADALQLMMALTHHVLPVTYFSDLTAAAADQRIFGAMVQHTYPRLCTLVCARTETSREGLAEAVSAVALRWFMCVYTLPFHAAWTDRVWDALLYEGTHVLFKVGLALFALCAPSLASCTSYADLCLSLDAAPSLTGNARVHACMWDANHVSATLPALSRAAAHILAHADPSAATTAAAVPSSDSVSASETGDAVHTDQLASPMWHARVVQPPPPLDELELPATASSPAPSPSVKVRHSRRTVSDAIPPSHALLARAVIKAPGTLTAPHTPPRTPVQSTSPSRRASESEAPVTPVQRPTQGSLLHESVCVDDTVMYVRSLRARAMRAHASGHALVHTPVSPAPELARSPVEARARTQTHAETARATGRGTPPAKRGSHIRPFQRLETEWERLRSRFTSSDGSPSATGSDSLPTNVVTLSSASIRALSTGTRVCDMTLCAAACGPSCAGVRLLACTRLPPVRPQSLQVLATVVHALRSAHGMTQRDVQALIDAAIAKVAAAAAGRLDADAEAPSIIDDGIQSLYPHGITPRVAAWMCEGSPAPAPLSSPLAHARFGRDGFAHTHINETAIAAYLNRPRDSSGAAGGPRTASASRSSINTRVRGYHAALTLPVTLPQAVLTNALYILAFTLTAREAAGYIWRVGAAVSQGYVLTRRREEGQSDPNAPPTDGEDDPALQLMHELTAEHEEAEEDDGPMQGVPRHASKSVVVPRPHTRTREVGDSPACLYTCMYALDDVRMEVMEEYFPAVQPEIAPAPAATPQDEDWEWQARIYDTPGLARAPSSTSIVTALDAFLVPHVDDPSSDASSGGTSSPAASPIITTLCGRTPVILDYFRVRYGSADAAAAAAATANAPSSRKRAATRASMTGTNMWRRMFPRTQQL